MDFCNITDLGAVNDPIDDKDLPNSGIQADQRIPDPTPRTPGKCGLWKLSTVCYYHYKVLSCPLVGDKRIIAGQNNKYLKKVLEMGPLRFMLPLQDLSSYKTRSH